jgi:hypothetical protein
MDTTAIEYTYEIFRSDEYMDTCLNKYLDKKKRDFMTTYTHEQT